MKYNLKQIMRRAWSIKKLDKNNIFAICLQMAWEEVKSVMDMDIITMSVTKNETFTIDTTTGIVTGKTYRSKEFLKNRFNAKWNGIHWTVDTEMLKNALILYPVEYAEYIITEKVITSKKLVNRYDGFYCRTTYTDGSVAYALVG